MTYGVEQDLRVGEVLKERYEVLRELGSGGQGRTYLGNDRLEGRQVAIKELHLGRVKDWKMLELFEREGRVLEGLSHPQIPAYVDSFRLERSGEMRFFLVQEFVDGENLEALVEGGLHTEEGQAWAFIEEMLGILAYLHGLSPPVVHRDIKPSNIMRRASDGRWVLIDFGAVQDREIVGGVGSVGAGGFSTIVGTSGYMALEQLMGRSVPATDLYGLGATVVYMLSRRHPSDLPVEGLKLDFRSFVNVSDGLKSFLGRMLEPYVEERFFSADEALGVLKSGRTGVGEGVVGVVRDSEEGRDDAGLGGASGAMSIGFGRDVAREDLQEVRAQWEEEKRMLAVRDAAMRAPGRLARKRAAALAHGKAAKFRGTLTKTEDGLVIRLPRKKQENGHLWAVGFGLLYMAFGGHRWRPMGLGSADVFFFICSLVSFLAIVVRRIFWSMEREVIEVRGGFLTYETGGLLGVKEQIALPVGSVRAIELVSGRDLQEHGVFTKVIVDMGMVDEVAVSTPAGVQLTFGKDLFMDEQGYIVREILAGRGFGHVSGMVAG